MVSFSDCARTATGFIAFILVLPARPLEMPPETG